VKRIAFVTDCLAVGGTEKHLSELLLRADGTRVQPSIVCLGPDVYTPVLRAGGRTNVAVHEVQPRTAARLAGAERVVGIEHLQAEHELPCVTTDIGGHDEILADKGAGILIWRILAGTRS
jgi:hypothetical protein